MDVESLLAASDYFRDLSAENRRAIAGLCREREVAKREPLFYEGQQGASVYVLARGSVQLVKTSPDGREIVVKTVVPGEFFAEVILFEKRVYPVTAMAVEQSTVLELPRADFRSLLDDPSFRDEFIAVLMGRLRYMADRILHLATDDVRERLLRFLEDHYGRKPSYDLPISKRDVAAAMAVTPETLSRLLLRMRQDEELTWQGRHLEIDPACWEWR